MSDTAGNRTRGGTYFVFDRLMWILSRESFTLAEYRARFEISRYTAFRDFRHLRDFGYAEIERRGGRDDGRYFVERRTEWAM